MIHAAYDMFCKYGIDGVSTARLAKAAHVSPSSIVRYFHNRAELVQCTQTMLWEEIADCILARCTTQRAASKNGFEEISVLLLNFQKLYEEHSEFLLFAYDYKSFLLRNHARMDEPFYDRVTHTARDAFIMALERGRSDGSICTNEPASSQFLVIWRIMLSFVDEIILCDRVYDGENPWKEQFCVVLRHILNGLKARY